MGWRLRGVGIDPFGVVIGLMRRVVGGGSGYPASSTESQNLTEQCRVRRYDPAEFALLRSHYPRRPEPRLVELEILFEAQDWPGLAEASATLRRRFPGLIEGYRHGVASLRALGRADEAERLAISTMWRFPRLAVGPEAYASCAPPGDLAELAVRWEIVRRRFPETPWAWLRCGDVLASLGRHEAAERLAVETLARFPAVLLAWQHAADIAERRGDWAVAAARWAEARARFEGAIMLYARETRVLLLDGRLAEAMALIEKACFMFPRDAAVLEQRAAVIAAGGTLAPMPG